MSSNTRTVLVTGATGQQGGAVARALLQRGHRVRALVRNPDAERARELEALGATLVRGSMDIVESIAAAAAGVDAVFGMTTPFTEGIDKEIEQGKNLVDGASRAGVGHFVYSSVASADQETGIPHFESKWEVEKHLVASGLPWTVTAPAYFYENVSSPWFAHEVEAGRWAQALPADRALQMIGIDDIGAINALVIEGGSTFYGERIDLATDELTGADVATHVGSASGRSIEYVELSIEDVRTAFGEDMALMYAWFDRVGYSVDIDALRMRFPDLAFESFAAWATRTFGSEDGR